jgi:N-acylneuraminate cytidylyltransferase/CMP-N,N'-diacetyllegionaminic acid synthase
LIAGKKIIALVPARSGSKGLPKKNIIDFLGKPLMAWSIEAATLSKYVDLVILSTDSQEIAEIGMRYGAEAPFLRPQDISQDTSSSLELIKHAVEYVQESYPETFDILVLLEPTSPLRTSVDIDLALEKLIEFEDAKSLVSLGKVELQHATIQVGVSIEGFVTLPLSAELFKHKRRQDIPENFFLDGSLYISYIHELLRYETFVHNKTIAFQMPKWKTIEIDDVYDYEMALCLARKFLL